MIRMQGKYKCQPSRFRTVFSMAGLMLLGSLLSYCNSGGGDGAGQRRQRSQVVTATDDGTTGATVETAGTIGSGVTGDSSVGGSDTGVGGATGASGSGSDGQSSSLSYKSTTISFGSGTNGQKLKGFYLRAASQTKAGPGLVLLHGMMGLNQDFKKNMETNK